MCGGDNFSLLLAAVGAPCPPGGREWSPTFVYTGLVSTLIKPHYLFRLISASPGIKAGSGPGPALEVTPVIVGTRAQTGHPINSTPLTGYRSGQQLRLETLRCQRRATSRALVLSTERLKCN